MPVALGGRLKGTIRVESEVPVTADFGLELECVETVTRGSGKNRRTEERMLWQKQWRVPRHQCQIGSFTTIPVDVAMPVGQPATSLEDGDGKITWRLEVAGECPGPDFWSKFELPVFETAETPEPADIATAPALNERPDNRTLAALGIDYERTPKAAKRGRSAAATTRASRSRSARLPWSGRSPPSYCSLPTRRFSSRSCSRYSTPCSSGGRCTCGSRSIA